MGFFGYVVCPCKAPFHFDFGGWRKKRQFFFIPEFLRLRTLGVLAWMILYCEGLSCAWDMSQRPRPVPAGGQQYSAPPQRWHPAVSSDMANVPWRAAATWTGNHGFNPFDTLCFYFLEMLRLISFKMQMKISLWIFVCWTWMEEISQEKSPFLLSRCFCISSVMEVPLGHVTSPFWPPLCHSLATQPEPAMGNVPEPLHYHLKYKWTCTFLSTAVRMEWDEGSFTHTAAPSWWRVDCSVGLVGA